MLGHSSHHSPLLFSPPCWTDGSRKQNLAVTDCERLGTDLLSLSWAVLLTGTRGKQVVTAGPSRPAIPREQLHLSSFLSAQPSTAQQCSSHSPATTAPQSSHPCPAPSRGTQWHRGLLTAAAAVGVDCRGCGTWRTASRRPLAWQRHTGFSANALRPCHPWTKDRSSSVSLLAS